MKSTLRNNAVWKSNYFTKTALTEMVGAAPFVVSQGFAISGLNYPVLLEKPARLPDGLF
ncbi:MAG: hypothetical protein GQ578_08735 [Desulfuromonadaceae bacterium]|nr:hypothetical protein [Desulfuromonadaceae bacterium]